MTRLLPAFPPLRWWSVHLDALRRGASPDDAAEEASLACRLRGKDFVRGSISGGVQITVPLDGGASASKKLRPGDSADFLTLSGHGKWRREHLGAFAAAYGKCPFFIHLMPELTEIYARSETDTRYGSMSEALYRLAMRWTGESLRLRDAAATNEVLRQRMEEMKTKVNIEFSIFDAIFRFGKETALCL